MLHGYLQDLFSFVVLWLVASVMLGIFQWVLELNIELERKLAIYLDVQKKSNVIEAERKSFTIEYWCRSASLLPYFRDAPWWIFIFTFCTVSLSISIFRNSMNRALFFSPARDRPPIETMELFTQAYTDVHRVCLVHIVYLFKLNFH